MRAIVAAACALASAFVPFASAHAQAQWQLVEDLRIGSDASEMTIFTDVRGIVAGPQGNVFVLDWRPQEIRMFDRTGRFVSLVARKGQGPGEIAQGNGMLLVRDTLWVNDPSNGRWGAWSATDGKFLRHFSIPINSFGYIWEAGTDAEGRIVQPISVPSGRTGPDGRPMSDRRLQRVRTDGRIADTLPLRGCQPRVIPSKTSFSGTNPDRGGSYVQIPYLPRPLMVTDGRGGFWCSPNDEYLLVHGSLAKGDTLQAVRQPYTRLAVPRAARDSQIQRIRTSLSRYQVVDADYSLIPDVQPVFVRLDADDKGQLWALRTTPAGAPLSFDVYDPAGRKTATVTTSLRFAPYRPLHFRGDYVYGVITDDDEVPHVVRARIVRGATPGRP